MYLYIIVVRVRERVSTTKLYRVISEGEYESLISNRQFN